ncbi:uncharacterized protein J3R85_016513 [Psidium guajava]|nr:uncharacterized protein J3R85_016513 [Psidium guajava]
MMANWNAHMPHSACRLRARIGMDRQFPVHLEAI